MTKNPFGWLRNTALVLAVLGGALGGCSKQGDFVYFVADKPPAKKVLFSQKVKELTGESRVDILFVIDNSASMSVYQRAVITNADMFIQNFTKSSGLDWRIGVISTDDHDLPYVGLVPGTQLQSSTPDALLRFQMAVGQLGTSGSGTEKTFTPVMNALTAYPAFVRRDGILALIAVTDADEQSMVPPSLFLDYLKKLKTSLDRVVMYGVFAVPDLGCSTEDSPWLYKGSAYEAVINQVKGRTYQLCSPTFGAELADMGKDLLKRVQSPRLVLSTRPDPKTLKVLFHGKELKGGPVAEGGYWFYDYDLNAIIFHNLDFAPGDTEEVEVSFSEVVS